MKRCWPRGSHTGILPGQSNFEAPVKTLWYIFPAVYVVLEASRASAASEIYSGDLMNIHTRLQWLQLTDF